MKNLINEQIEATSGGSQGVYTEDGVTCQINCPSVSQPCLDRFLMCTEETLTKDEVYDCMKAVANDFGIHGLAEVFNCVDAHLT